MACPWGSIYVLLLLCTLGNSTLIFFGGELTPFEGLVQLTLSYNLNFLKQKALPRVFEHLCFLNIQVSFQVCFFSLSSLL